MLNRSPSSPSNMIRKHDCRKFQLPAPFVVCGIRSSAGHSFDSSRNSMNDKWEIRTRPSLLIVRTDFSSLSMYPIFSGATEWEKKCRRCWLCSGVFAKTNVRNSGCKIPGWETIRALRWLVIWAYNWSRLFSCSGLCPERRSSSCSSGTPFSMNRIAVSAQMEQWCLPSALQKKQWKCGRYGVLSRSRRSKKVCAIGSAFGSWRT